MSFACPGRTTRSAPRPSASFQSLRVFTCGARAAFATSRRQGSCLPTRSRPSLTRIVATIKSFPRPKERTVATIAELDCRFVDLEQVLGGVLAGQLVRRTAQLRLADPVRGDVLRQAERADQLVNRVR